MNYIENFEADSGAAPGLRMDSMESEAHSGWQPGMEGSPGAAYDTSAKHFQATMSESRSESISPGR